MKVYRNVSGSGDSLLVVNKETLTGNKVLTVADIVIQWLDPGGASRDVMAPPEADSTDLMFWIYNYGTVAGKNLVFKNDGGIEIATIGPGMTGIFSCDGTDWKHENNLGIYYDAQSDEITINASKVGISKTSPAHVLDIYSATPRINLADSGDVYTAYIRLNPSYPYGLEFFTNGNMIFSASGAEMFRTNGTDKVGIKTTIPVCTLDVNGAINSRSYYECDDFDEEASGVQLEAGVDADKWAGGGTNYASANVVYGEGAGGTLDIATAGADDDSAWIMGTGVWRIDENPVFEAYFKMADVSNGFCGVGFVEGSFNDKGAYDDDICLVGIDSDNAHGYGADQLVLITNDNGAGVIIDNLGIQVTAGTYLKVSVNLTDTEQPVVYVNGTKVGAGSIAGTVQAGITVKKYAMVQSLSAAVDTLTVDYIKAWQDRE